MSLLLWQLNNSSAAAKTGAASYYDADFISRAVDPFGDAITARAYVRLNDGASGEPSTLVEFDKEGFDVLNVSKIRRRRELSFGVVQGQAWQIVVSTNDNALMSYSLSSCWCCLQAGFEDDDVWQTFAQGKIRDVQFNGDGTATIEVHDAIVDMLKYTLQRPYNFQYYAHPGEMSPVAVNDGSNSYSNEDGGITFFGTFGWVYTVDERFVIEFTSNDEFKVILESGDETQTGDIYTDLNIKNSDNHTTVTLSAAGWDTTGSLYNIGDTWEFYSTENVQGVDSTPVRMVRRIIQEFCGIEVYDVINGAYYSSPFFDETTWSQAVADTSDAITAVNNTYTINGSWDKGSTAKKMIQDALSLVHGSIFPTHTGQIGIWLLRPSSGAEITLNGNSGSGSVDIIDTPSVRKHLDDYANSVTIEYLTPAGDEATYTASTDSIIYGQDIAKTMSIGWRCRGEVAQSCANIFLNRYSQESREYILPTTLAGILADVGTGIAMFDDAIGATGEIADTIDVQIDLLGQKARIKCAVDPVSTVGYFIIGTSVVGGTDRIW